MCDQTIPYESGTWVWTKVLNKIWWPGKVVNLSDTPEDYQNYVADKKRNIFAIVYFDADKTHDMVINMSKIMLYNCPNKMELVEKGHALYKRQLKGSAVIGNFVMKNFISDVKLAERETGGDEDIFVELENKSKVVQPHINISELFVSSKDRKKKKKSLLVPKTHSAFENKKKCVNTSCKAITMISGVYWCHIKKGCGFNSKRFENLKRHMKMHEEEDKQKLNAKLCKNDPSVSGYRASNARSAKAQFRTSKSLKNSKTKKLDTKKIKLQDELLKDWDEDDDDLGESTDLSNANEASTSNQVFDFDEDDSNDSVIISGLRRNESTQLLENSDTTLFQISSLEHSFGNTSDKNKDAPAIVNKKQISSDNDSNGTNIVLTNAKPYNLKSQELNNADREEKLSITDDASINNEVNVNSTRGGHFDGCLSNIPTPDWVKQDAWNTFEHSGLDKVEDFMTLDDQLWKQPLPNVFTPFISKEIASPKEPLFAHKITSDKLPPTYTRLTMWIPKIQNVTKYTDEELLQMPFIQEIQQKVSTGNIDDVFISIPGSKILKG